MSKQQKINEALEILIELGMPKAQQNERSALCLLALLNLTPGNEWSQIEKPLIGITPIMDWCREFYDKVYAPNTRETIRRQSIHQFVDAGIALHNPDDLSRPINSPHTVYQIEPELLEILKKYKSEGWENLLQEYLSKRNSLIEQYAKRRDHLLVPIQIDEETEIKLSAGDHSELMRAIIYDFAPRFTPGAKLVYIGDTGEKSRYFDKDLLSTLGTNIDTHGKMPDVILFYEDKNWLLLVEAVTSHGPVDGKRYSELLELFSTSKAGLVFVTAFPSKTEFTRYATNISWETEVWISENPSHLIHFDGKRFLGPYSTK